MSDRRIAELVERRSPWARWQEWEDEILLSCYRYLVRYCARAVAHQIKRSPKAVSERARRLRASHARRRWTAQERQRALRGEPVPGRSPLAIRIMRCRMRQNGV